MAKEKYKDQAACIQHISFLVYGDAPAVEFDAAGPEPKKYNREDIKRFVEDKLGYIVRVKLKTPITIAELNRRRPYVRNKSHELVDSVYMTRPEGFGPVRIPTWMLPIFMKHTGQWGRLDEDARVWLSTQTPKEGEYPDILFINGVPR